jgi:hypothetical protein
LDWTGEGTATSVGVECPDGPPSEAADEDDAEEGEHDPALLERPEGEDE